MLNYTGVVEVVGSIPTYLSPGVFSLEKKFQDLYTGVIGLTLMMEFRLES